MSDYEDLRVDMSAPVEMQGFDIVNEASAANQASFKRLAGSFNFGNLGVYVSILPLTGRKITQRHLLRWISTAV